MSFKKESRQRRARKARSRISSSGKVRLCVTRSCKYITAQLIKSGIVDSASDVVLGCISSNQAELKSALKGHTSNKDAAESALSEFSGVSLDDEAAHLLEFQQAYQASARLLQTARELFQSLIEVV